MYSLIDTHCHIYDASLTSQIQDVLSRASSEGVTHILMPNIDMSSIDEMLKVEIAHKECIAMMGLHPCYVKDDYEEQLKTIEKLHSERSFVGVGEIGIDLYWDKTYVEEQIVCFRRQIELAKELKLPVSIHSRECLDLTIKICKELQNGDLSGVFHCFNGSAKQLSQVQDLGMYVGVGGVITYKNAKMDTTFEGSDLSNVVLETDAPYLAPVPRRGKTNEPSFLVHIAEKLGEFTNKSLSEIAEITSDNAKKVFKL